MRKKMSNREIIDFNKNDYNSSDVDIQPSTDDLLVSIRKRKEEISIMNGTLQDLDSIALLTSETIDKDLWQGAISLSERLDDGSYSTDQLIQAKEILAAKYTEIHKGAPIRCIHAGKLIDYDPKKAEDYARPLGPQFAGGTIGQSISRRIVIIDEKTQFDSNQFIEDFKTEANAASILGLKPGNHQGEHATEEKTGCGAVDGMESILDLFSNKERSEVAQKLAMVIAETAFGKDYSDQDLMNEVINSFVILAKNKETYLKSKKEMLNLVEDANNKGAPKLDNNSNASFIVINTLPNTTLLTDDYDEETEDKAKAFSFDVWHLKDLAATNFNDLVDQKKFILASALFNCAAAMSLTDGSQKLIVRS